MESRQPQDQRHRERIARALGENLFVEAGAGTGKTTALVQRVVTLVTEGETTMAGLAAITFTEAAAAELRDRVRHALETADDAADDAQRARRRAAVETMDAAAIQTLHSFAQALLREMPLAAGLPPAFELLDPIAADMRFAQAWDEWLEGALDSDELSPHFARALRLGLGLGELQACAQELRKDYDLVSRRPVDAPPLAPAVTLGRKLLRHAPELSRLTGLAENPDTDPLRRHVDGVLALAEQLAEHGVDTATEGSAVVRLLGARRLSTTAGNQRNWLSDPATGVNACKRTKEILKELDDTRKAEMEGLRLASFLPLVEAVRRFVVGQAAQRKADGLAEFHDLLVWARDMLRDVPEARRHFRRRFQRVLVDEFQDTDPIQAEIAFLLAGDPDADIDTAGLDWQTVAPGPGRLFVVGDPKQSIYRFRRADIAAMGEVRGLLGQDAVPLQQNFRSVPDIINWVNHVFGQWMQADVDRAVQAAYQELLPWWPAPGLGEPFGVHRLGGPVADANALETRRVEANAIAALAREVKERPWRVRDQATEAMRDATYSDICLLMPTRTGLDALEGALEAAAVPYRIESESIVLQTQDVRDLLACLRAVDSPGDQVALVAALRSTAFACSDVELLAHVDGGGRLDYLSPGAVDGAVADALAVLRRYHDDRLWTAPDDLIERFIRERRLVELAFGRARPRERWRRLRFVVESARGRQRAGVASLRGFLDGIERLVEENARTVEAPEPEMDEDCVRIMTVHAAKGLEFPIVVLTGLAATPRHTAGRVKVDRRTGQTEFRLSIGGNDHQESPGFAALDDVERAAEEAERVRLAYVACTRARDHLVLSLFRGNARGSGDSAASRMEAYCEAGPLLWEEIDWQGLVNGGRAAPAPTSAPTPDDFAGRRAEWAAQRAALIDGASRREAEAATAIVQRARERAAPPPHTPDAEDDVLDAVAAKEEAEDGEAAYRRGRGGSNIGRAVHAVLQSIDLLTGEGVEGLSRAQAAAEGVGGEWRQVSTLARAALDSDTLKQLRAQVAAGEATFYREVFVSAPLGGRLVEGFIDLLIAGPEGLTIVDYKTDQLTAAQIATLGPAYLVQLGLYAHAVEATTGQTVHDAVLLFMRPGEERRYDDVAALKSAARAAAEA